MSLGNKEVDPSLGKETTDFFHRSGIKKTASATQKKGHFSPGWQKSKGWRWFQKVKKSLKDEDWMAQRVRSFKTGLHKNFGQGYLVGASLFTGAAKETLIEKISRQKPLFPQSQSSAGGEGFLPAYPVNRAYRQTTTTPCAKTKLFHLGRRNDPTTTRPNRFHILLGPIFARRVS